MAKQDLSFLQDLGSLRDSFKPVPDSPFYRKLTAFVATKITEAKTNLRDANSSSTGTLESSIAPNVTIEDEKIIVEVLAEDYWEYIDKGVNGLERNQRSPFSFRNLGVSEAMALSFENFIKNRGITSILTRNSQGETIEKILSTASDYKGASYHFAKATKKKGIERTDFFNSVFNQEAFDELGEILGREVVNILR